MFFIVESNNTDTGDMAHTDQRKLGNLEIQRIVPRLGNC